MSRLSSLMRQLSELSPFSHAESKPSYNLGVALSGGGARGFAHAGALKALQEAGLKPDIVAGVSAGSVAGSFFCAGKQPEELLKAFEGHKLTNLTRLRLHGGGLMDLEPFRAFMDESLAPYARLQDLPVPLLVGATNLNECRSVLFSHGPLGLCVAASCAIPVVFKPVKINGVPYVDGGVLRNLPAWALRQRCKHVIGINVSPLAPKTHVNPDSMIDVALRSYAMLAKSNQPQDIALCDLMIPINAVAGYKVFNLKEIRHVFECGYATARLALAEAGWSKGIPE